MFTNHQICDSYISKLDQAAKMPLKVWSDESPDPESEVHQHPINRNRMRHRGKNDDTIKGLPFIDVPTDAHNSYLEGNLNLNLQNYCIFYCFGIQH